MAHTFSHSANKALEPSCTGMQGVAVLGLPSLLGVGVTLGDCVGVGVCSLWEE